MKHPLPVLLTGVLVMTACQAQINDTENDSSLGAASSSSVSSEQVSDLPAGDFTFTGTSNPSGTAYVRGYANTETVTDPFCEETGEPCEEFTYVFFEVQETSSRDLQEFMRQNQGNAYAGPARIGLGCQEASTIVYQNDSDQFGRQEQTIAGTGAVQILNSSMLDPVVLALRKLPFNGGSEAPPCYAHFTEVEVVEE